MLRRAVGDDFAFVQFVGEADVDLADLARKGERHPAARRRLFCGKSAFRSHSALLRNSSESIYELQEAAGQLQER